MRLVITKIEHDYKGAPSWIQVTIFNQAGAEQSRFQVPISLFGTKELEIGQRLLLMPVPKESK